MAHATRGRVRGLSLNVRYVQSEGHRADIDKRDRAFMVTELKLTSVRTDELKTRRRDICTSSTSAEK